MNLENHKIQKMKNGSGAGYHRVYSIRVPASFASAEKAMRDLQTDFNRFSPQLLATFEKASGSSEQLKRGDEFQIHITGPWNGPVRVADVSATSFRLLTLEGHLEAGEIKFLIKKISESEVEFEIESLARSRDFLVDFVYDKVPVAKLAQTTMWTSFCKNFGRRVLEIESKDLNPADVHIVTERRDEETGEWQRI